MKTRLLTLSCLTLVFVAALKFTPVNVMADGCTGGGNCTTSADCPGYTPPVNCEGTSSYCPSGTYDSGGNCIGGMAICPNSGTCVGSSASYSCGKCIASCYCAGYSSTDPSCGGVPTCGGPSDCDWSGTGCGGAGSGGPPPPPPPPPSSTPTCNSITGSVTPVPDGSSQSISFSLSGDGSTYFGDGSPQFGGGVSSCGAVGWNGSGGSTTCTTATPASSQDYSWIHTWKHCVGSITNCSSTCSTPPVDYTVIAPPTGAINITVGPACQSEGVPQMNLSWNQPTNVTGLDSYTYHIYRNGSNIANTTATSWIDVGVTPGTSISYYIIAQNMSGTDTSSTTTQTSAWCDYTAPNPPFIQTVFSAGGCYNAATWPNPVQVYASDNTAHPNPSGIKYVTLYLHRASDGSLLSSFLSSMVTPPRQTPVIAPIDVPFARAIPQNTLLYFTATAQDYADHISSPSSPTNNFYTNNICAKPYLQTENGDVHSNGSITINGKAPAP